MSYPELKMLIAGEWVFGSTGKSEPVICPADGSEIGQVPHASQQILIAPSIAAAMGSTIGGQ
jgi:acyl-CoA reductase-like NAD-dependent aldehyde dehydrogenase